jgi:hypothetical protein
MVSTQPELPVRCCTSQAPAIGADSDSAIAASASKYKITLQKPVKLLWRQTFVKYAATPSPVSCRSSVPPALERP